MVQLYLICLIDRDLKSLTTVYNSVHTLVEYGLLRELQLEPGVTRYDLAPQPRHAHFVCRRCGRIFDQPWPEGMQLSPTAGFNVDSVDILLKGICPNCKPSDINDC